MAATVDLNLNGNKKRNRIIMGVLGVLFFLYLALTGSKEEAECYASVVQNYKCAANDQACQSIKRDAEKACKQN